MILKIHFPFFSAETSDFFVYKVIIKIGDNNEFYNGINTFFGSCFSIFTFY